MADNNPYNLPGIIDFGEIEFEKPPRPAFVHDTYAQRIENSWANGFAVDAAGWLWIDTGKLISILCTDKHQADFCVAQAPANCKTCIGETNCILGSYVLFLIDQNIQKASATTRRARTFSRDCYTSIQDNPIVVERQTAYQEFFTKAKGKLKSSRLKLTQYNQDELTGEPLIRRTAEFHHIFSAQLFPHLALNETYGIVINRQTHEEVHANSALHPHDLYELCERKGWKLEWHQGLTLAFPAGFPR